MAERRMFSKHVIDSDQFLNMPLSSQVLYFHLAMRADDDGFVNNPQKLTRMIGASPDDFNILVAKQFILTFDTGIIVIKHWRLHNYIQSDRYKPTLHQQEKALLSHNKDSGYTMDTDCIQNGYTGKVRLEIGKSKDNKTIDRFDTFWSAYPKKIGKDKCRRWFDSHKVDDSMFTEMIKALEIHKKSTQWVKDGGQFIPHPYTWLNQGRWQDEITQSRWDMIEGEL